MGGPRWGFPRWKGGVGGPRWHFPRWKCEMGGPRWGFPRWKYEMGGPRWGFPRWKWGMGGPRSGCPRGKYEMGGPRCSSPQGGSGGWTKPVLPRASARSATKKARQSDRRGWGRRGSLTPHHRRSRRESISTYSTATPSYSARSGSRSLATHHSQEGEITRSCRLLPTTSA
jgi:hypothetical protein